MDTWLELELATKEVLSDPTLASRFWSKAQATLVSIGTVKAALAYARAL
jgi:hypothetical protein